MSLFFHSVWLDTFRTSACSVLFWALCMWIQWILTTTPQRTYYIHPHFIDEGNWGTEWLNNLPRVMQLVSSRGRIWAQAVWVQSPHPEWPSRTTLVNKASLWTPQKQPKGIRKTIRARVPPVCKHEALCCSHTCLFSTYYVHTLRWDRMQRKTDEVPALLEPTVQRWHQTSVKESTWNYRSMCKKVLI